ncbi:recombinase family protein [Methylocystis parvus]|uniref:recombinase family protein n=1 Tax=Methylocystis parvus TaxID=134 RepID=UPI003C751A79
MAGAIKALGELVTRLDRLARSTRDLLNIPDAVGEAGAGFRSFNEALAALAEGIATQADLVRRFNVNRITISRLS